MTARRRRRRILEARLRDCFELTVPELRSFYPRIVPRGSRHGREYRKALP